MGRGGVNSFPLYVSFEMEILFQNKFCLFPTAPHEIVQIYIERWCNIETEASWKYFWQFILGNLTRGLFCFLFFLRKQIESKWAE